MAKIFVGMSGGIDSSATAYLLQKAGHEIVGLTFTAMEETGSKKCCSVEEIGQAKRVCKFLGIEHRIVDLKDLFELKVIRPFIRYYKEGKVPNPCAFCNRFIKFGSLVEYSLANDADFFATGHYVTLIEENEKFFIKRGSDPLKDQSYFLGLVDPEMLPFIKFPLADYEKPQVREIIKNSGIPINSNKAESQDVCFIKTDYRDFLKERKVSGQKGDFVYRGKKVGSHEGLPFYSYGQRRGLNVSTGERVFVRDIDHEKNNIILGQKPLSKQFIIEKVNIFETPLENCIYEVQTRYHSKISKATIKKHENEFLVDLDNVQEIVTPGQIAVFYKDNKIHFAGEIKKIILEKEK